MSQTYSNNGASLQGMRELVATLRGENGCPWDQKQTPESMRVYLVEEMYELLDALESGLPMAVQEELGDVLFHVFFLSRIFEEEGQFTVFDVAQANTDKMVARHPHVFGDDKAKTAEEVRARWHEFKKNQVGKKEEKGTLDSIPKSLPALMRAYRVCERASRVDFHCPDPETALESLDAQWKDLKQAYEGQDKEAINERLGKFLFDLAGCSRQAGVHPENALSEAIESFSQRFSSMEEKLQGAGKDVESASREEMNQAFKKV